MDTQDQLLTDITTYVMETEIDSDLAFETARNVLIDSLGCGFLALSYPECTKLLGPIIKGTTVPLGSRVPGTTYELDPVQAAFNIGTMIRWLDYNDTWLAAEWGHPSDNLGGILAVADYVGRRNFAKGLPPLLVKDILEAMIKAHEIQGILALDNSLNRVGLDHVLFVKVATAAVVTKMLGGKHEEVYASLSHAWLDNSSLRTYRHFPNTGSRKSWAAGDATSRGVRLAFMVMQGEMGYTTPLSAHGWGFEDVLFDGKKLTLQQPLKSYVMENILFKISYPAEFHAQTAAECAVELSPKVSGQIENIDKIVISTQEPAIRIIDKKGPLYNPADRDHCIQYITAIGLLFGTVEADHYEDDVASDPRVDSLRSKMEVVEDRQYTEDYLNPSKRSIANAVQIYFKDGSQTEKVVYEYPLGHRFRRKEAIPKLLEKFKRNLELRFPYKQVQKIYQMNQSLEELKEISATNYLEELII